MQDKRKDKDDERGDRATGEAKDKNQNQNQSQRQRGEQQAPPKDQQAKRP